MILGQVSYDTFSRVLNGENCQDFEDCLRQESRKCASFMSNGVML